MKLSVVTTLYKSSPYIDEFHERIIGEVKKITDDYEVIYVDDGSPDDSLIKAIHWSKIDSRVVIIELSRNFGHHKALMTGLVHAAGDYVFLIDSDLEEQPELLGNFWTELLQDDSFDVIYGIQERRKGSFFERLSGRIFYKITEWLVDEISYPADTLTTRLMTKRYVESVIKSDEYAYDLWSIFEYTGFKTKSLRCSKGSKPNSEYTLGKKIKMAINIVVTTSSKPLFVIFYMGLLVFVFSLLYLLFALFNRAFFEVPMGWTSVIIFLCLVLGILIFSIGVLGAYISVIFHEVKGRRVIVKKVHSEGKNGF